MNRNLTRRALFVLLAAAIGVAIPYRDQFDATALEQWVQKAGAGGNGTVYAHLCIHYNIVFTRLCINTGRRRAVWPYMGYII